MLRWPNADSRQVTLSDAVSNAVEMEREGGIVYIPVVTRILGQLNRVVKLILAEWFCGCMRVCEAS